MPKQFLIAERAYQRLQNARITTFAGYQIHTAKDVPLVSVKDGQARQTGLMVGWVIHNAKLLSDGAEIEAPCGLSSIFPALSGRFVCLWQEHGGLFFRLDASGFLPAVFAQYQKLIASTSSLIDALHSLDVNEDIKSIFEFPKRRGFLPFGLTQYWGVRRLLPNHVLSLMTWRESRVWPTAEFCSMPLLSQLQVPAAVSEIASIVKAHIAGIVTGNMGLLYLSGGHDSRMVLAACRDFRDRMTCETLTNGRNPEARIAARVAQKAGVKHVVTDVVPTPRGEVTAWLHRTGYTFYDPLTELAETARVNDRHYHVMDGTGAEITRATNWSTRDLDRPRLSLDVLLKRIRIPDTPILRAAGSAWLNSLPAMDATMALDIAKIEQIHGCWAGVGVYGHLNSYPSMSPFSSLRINQLALRLPKHYRFNGHFYHDYMALLWPELLEVPVNRVTGIERFLYIRYELKRLIPARLKRWLKPLR